MTPARRAADVLHTIGYEQRSVPDFLALLRDARIDVLVDVRDNANSRKPGFSQRALEHALAAAGISYVHAAFAGTPKWLRDNADSHAQILEWYAWYLTEFDEIVPVFDAQVTGMLAAGRNVCTMCFERDPAQCHRAILAERWRMRRTAARRVVHLGTA